MPIDKNEDGITGANSIIKALDLLECFSIHSPTLSVMDLSKRLNMPFSSTARIARTLQSKGFLERDEETKRYKLGRKIYFLGYISKDTDYFHRIALPHLEKLRNDFQETAALYLREGRYRICFEQVTSTQPLRHSSEMGEKHIMWAGASSKVFLAFMSSQERDEILKEIKPMTPKTITDNLALKKEILKVKKSGYAISIDEFTEGYSAIAAPIFNARGHMIASLSLTGPTFRFTNDKINSMTIGVRDCAIRISMEMGSTRTRIENGNYYLEPMAFEETAE